MVVEVVQRMSKLQTLCSFLPHHIRLTTILNTLTSLIIIIIITIAGLFLTEIPKNK